MKKYLFLLTISALILNFTACKNDSLTTPTTDCAGVTPTYTNDIKTIMDANCATSGCHNASAKASGKDFSTFNNCKNESMSNSFLGSMKHSSGYTAMPKGAAKLSDAQIKLVECWIKNGTPQ